LGLLLDESRLSEPIGIKYDPRSQRAGVPVIAVYCRYELTDSEIASIEAYREPDGDEAALGPVIFYAVHELVHRKREHRETLIKDIHDFEAECHAPLEAIEILAQTSVRT
jgi:hypothetical protein